MIFQGLFCVVFDGFRGKGFLCRRTILYEEVEKSYLCCCFMSNLDSTAKCLDAFPIASTKEPLLERYY